MIKYKCKTYVKPRKKLNLIVWTAKEADDKAVVLEDYWDCVIDSIVDTMIDESRGK